MQSVLLSPSDPLLKRTVMLSGASRGIGLAIARQLLRDGHRISLGLRDPLRSYSAEFNSLLGTSESIHMHSYDAADPDSARKWVASTVSWAETVDTIIVCAGILRETPLLFKDSEQSDLDDLWRINVMGPWWLARAAWPHLASSGHGRIQVLVSMSGQRVKGRMAGYPVSKFALMGLCQSMRNEGWASGIRVTAICPSWVNTQMARSVSSVNPDAMSQPEDIATISSTILRMPNASVPFELNLNCALETL